MMPLKEKVREVTGTVLLLWRTWNIHGFVLFSFSLQIILFFVAPFRKKCNFPLVAVSIWLVYMLVNTAINQSLALIVSANRTDSEKAAFVDLYTFWAAFLVMHFGGPDTITALATADNNLWRRSYVHIGMFIVATANAVLAVPKEKRQSRPLILLSTLSIFFAGVIKCLERFTSLARASFPTFKRSLVRNQPIIGPDYAVVMEHYNFYTRSGIPARFGEILKARAVAEPDSSAGMPIMIAINSNAPAEVGPESTNPPFEDGPLSSAGVISMLGDITEAPGEANDDSILPHTVKELNDAEVIMLAFDFFQKFKGTYVDMAFCCHHRKESRDCFLRLSPKDAFKILETEVKFAYQTFYTKMPLLSTKKSFNCTKMPFLSTKMPFLSVPIALLRRWSSFILELFALVFWLWEYQSALQPFDVKFTRALLFGTVLIDIIAFIRFYSSDWIIGQSGLRRKKMGSPSVSLPHKLVLYAKRHPWGEMPEDTTSQLAYYLHWVNRQWSESISQFNFINYCVDERCESSNTFYQWIGATDMMDGWRYVSKTRFTTSLRDFIFEELRRKSSMAEIIDIGEEISLARGSWTLRLNATENLDPTDFEPWIMDVEYDESLMIFHIATELYYQTHSEPVHNSDENGYRELSKILSDYMLYLLRRQLVLMLEPAPMAQVIFKDTSEEARRFLHEVFPNSKCTLMIKEVCQRLVEVISSQTPPSYIKEEDNNSVLFDACLLAKHFSVKSTPWKLIAQIWVELLCFAAQHSPGNIHAVLLSQGGELVTLVRLLMLHFGISNQFRRLKFLPQKELVVDM